VFFPPTPFVSSFMRWLTIWNFLRALATLEPIKTGR
jgi:hypothetical protein